jgi:hypothetical protein
MKPCKALSSRYSALVDGELTALESVIVRQHLALCDRCQDEVRSLERLKLLVHYHGRDPKPLGILETEIRSALDAEDAATRRRNWSRGLGVGIAAMMCAFVWQIGIVGLDPEPVETTASVEGRLAEAPTESVVRPEALPRRGPPVTRASHRRALDESLLADLVRHHRKEGSMSKDVRAALVYFEALPIRFLDSRGRAAPMVNASYQSCRRSRSGASLAVLDAASVSLPPRARAGLDTAGVYVEGWDGVEVRISQNGQRLYVLLTDQAPGFDSPI